MRLQTPLCSGHGVLIWTASVLFAGGVLAGAASQTPCAECLRSRYWTIDARAWLGVGGDFPEGERLRRERPVDLGISFSGGGTRSTTATLGQLRGLAQNGWLDKVRYISAVSGGAWAAVPFTFSKLERNALLGRFEQPGELDFTQVTEVPNGALASAVTDSSLKSSILREVVGQSGQAAVRNAEEAYRQALVSLFDRLSGERDRTFTRLIKTAFINPLVPSGGERFVAWDSEQVAEILRANPTLSYTDFLTTNSRDRPFLIVGASMVLTHPNYTYPRLIPVEYTPLYSGARQQFGGKLGGSYVWSWAYGSERYEALSAEFAEVRRGQGERRFSIADMAASTGAAPQLYLLLGGPTPRYASLVRRAADVFPSFHHPSIRTGRSRVDTTYLPHGDGGFTDNVGLMPLLARHVRNIIAFVNAKSEFDENRDVESFFRPVLERSRSGDRTMNRVFDEARYRELIEGFRDRVTSGRAVVYCGEHWAVKGNEYYNISAYDDLNICWVYNHTATDWERQLPPDVKELLHPNGGKNVTIKQEIGSFEDFPWYGTFFQNAPHFIQLTVAQVNLLANLSAWSVTNEDSIEKIVSALKVLDPPP